MLTKLMTSAVAILAAALFAYLGRTTILAYGAARYQAGLADARLQQMPQILSANEAVAKVATEARDRMLAAETSRAGEAARLATLIERSQEEARAYETNDAGLAGCLGAERVRAIESARAALFPAALPASAGAGDPGPVPADAAHDDGGRQPE